MEVANRRPAVRHGVTWYVWIAIAAVFAVAYLYFVNIYGSVGVRDMLLFVIAQLAFVLIPGMALAIHINLPRDRTVLIIVSYMLGIGVVIGEYYLFYALGLRDGLLICMCVVSAVSLTLIIFRRDRLMRIKPVSGSFPARFAFAAVFLIAVLFLTVSNYKTPDMTAGGYSFIYQDLLWNAGTTSAIADGLPVMDIHINGLDFTYHYFAQVFLAVFKNILGISSYLLEFRFLAVIQVIVFTGGLYLLFSLLFKNRWLVALCALTASLMSYLILNHMFFNAYATPVGMGLALAAAYYFIRFVKRMETAGHFSRDFVMFLILLAIATGVKTLYTAGMAAGAGVLMLVQLIRRKNPAVMVTSGAAMLAVFFGVYFLLAYGTHTFNNLQPAFASIMWMAGEPAYYSAAVANLGPYLPSMVVKLITYPLYMLINYPVAVVAMVMLLVYLVKRRGGERGARLALFLLCSIVAGFAATSVFYQPGMSNILFMEGTIPLCAFAMIFTAKSWFVSSFAKKSVKAALGVILAVVFIFTGFNTISAIRVDALTSIGKREGLEGTVSPYDAISKSEYEGMLWLKAYTPEDAVFACDRQYYVPDEQLTNARYYYYTAFSERWCYLEGYNYVNTHNANFEAVIAGRLNVLNGAYSNDAASIERLKADGVSYLVASALMHPGFVLDEAYGTISFQNAGITIYSLIP